MRSRWVRLGSVLFATLLIAAACGGDDDGGGNGGETAATGATGETGEPAVPLEDQSLVWGQFGAYTPEGFLEAFTAETGVDITISEFSTNEDMIGKLTAAGGTGYDVVSLTGNYLQQLVDNGWAAELDHAQIPNMSNLFPEVADLAFDPGNVYTVPYTWGTTGLCYRTDMVPAAPTSWNDLLSPAPELRGKVTILGTERWLLQPALLSLGYSINTEDAAQIGEARDLTIEAKQHILQFNETDFYARLDDGSAGMVHAWDGWCNYATNENVEFVVPQEGSDLFADVLMITASSENKEAAHAFLNFVLAPENHVQVAELVLYKVPNGPAMDLLDPALIEAYPNLGMTAEELLANEEDLPLSAEGQALWSQAVAEVKAA
jgi:spermidine/putrescine transport system substrate-binding protein